MQKICPKCHREYEGGRFCNDCGALLIYKQPSLQQRGGFNLSLGDANAISGGVNMSDNHSINTTSNVDSHNVITNNITQVERDKSPEEIKHERKLAFREACLEVYSNGIMTSEGKRKLDDLQYRLGLDEVSAHNIISEVAKRSERKASTLPTNHLIAFNNIKTFIRTNRLDMVNRLMPQLKIMAQRYSVEEVQFTYSMLQAILHPQECIEEYSKCYVDNYWQTFWTSIAYRLVNNDKSHDLADELSRKWPDSPAGEVLILSTTNAILSNDIELAESYIQHIQIDNYSEHLYKLFLCIDLVLHGNEYDSDQQKQMQDECLFLTSTLFADFISKQNEKTRLIQEADAKRLVEEKRMQEEAEAKRLAKEKRMQEEAEAKRLAEEKQQQTSVQSTPFDTKSLAPYTNKFGYLRSLNDTEISKLKSILAAAPKTNYEAQFCLGQLYLQENETAVNQKLAYDAIKSASEHGVYEASAYMAYFYLYGKVVSQDFDEAERRMKIDDDYKKNPVFIQMLVDLYTQKGNAMLADVWKSKLSRFNIM